MFMPRLLKISLAAGLTMPLLAIADNPPPAGPIADISDQLETLDGKVDTVQSSVDALDVKVDSLKNEVDLILGSMMVPFRTTIGGGLCNSSTKNSSNPEIDISGELSGATFVINSILIQTDSSFTEQDRIFSVNSVTVDGAFFRTSTKRLFDTYSNNSPSGGFVSPGFDLMGLRLREAVSDGSPDEGGVFPTQIAATSDGDVDINVTLFCRSDNSDWYIARISVAGMKQVDDVITVSYTPGE